MNELKYGILEIDGQLLTPNITPDCAAERFSKYITYQNTFDSRTTICLDEVLLFGVMFELRLSFRNGKLRFIKMESQREKMPWKKVFELDCIWLEELLGKPDHAARTDGVSGPYAARYSNTYYGKGCMISSSYEDDLRCGEDANITINYGE